MLAAGRFACACWVVLGAAALGPPPRAGADATPTPPGAPANTADSLSIEDCIRLARAIAPGVRAASADYRAAALDSTSVTRTRRWALSLFGNATVSPRGSYDPTFTNLGQYELKAGVELPVLDAGSRRRTRERAGLVARAAGVTLVQERRDAGLRAAELAVESLRLGDLAAAETESFAWLERLSSLMGSGVAGGARTRSDALRVTLERDAVQTELASTRKAADQVRRELDLLLGRPADAALGVRAPDSTHEHAPDSADLERISAGAEQAPEVRLADVAEAQARVDLAETERRNALRAEVSADAGWAGTDLTRLVPPDLRDSNPHATFADRLRRDLGSSAAVRAVVPIADPSLRPAVDARRAAAEAAGIRRELERGTQRRIGLDLLAAWRIAHERLAAARSTAARAEEHLLRMKSLHAAGTVTLLELLDGRSVVDDARARLAEARADERLARVSAELRR